jgi:hypothetical protein
LNLFWALLIHHLPRNEQKSGLGRKKFSLNLRRKWDWPVFMFWGSGK